MAVGLIDPAGHASGTIGSSAIGTGRLGRGGASTRRADAGAGDADSLVIDHGFVALAMRGRDGLRLRLRPSRVTGAALARVCYVLADRRPARVLVAHFADDVQQWRHEMCGDWMDALRRLDALCAHPPAQRPA
jgi:hypothetical protein